MFLRKLDWQIKNLLFEAISTQNCGKNTTLNTVIIFGSGRSGTTWVAELLSSDKNTILIDEPLKIENSYKVQKLGFTGWGQYIPEYENNWPEAKKYFDDILSGSKYNPNQVRHSIYRIFKAKNFVVKFIRAHFLMPWLISNFQINPPIFIIRNPYRVINSQLNHPGWGLGKNSLYKNGVDIPHIQHYKDFYLKFKDHYKSIRYIEENLALRWCIENQFVIDHPYHNTKWKAFHYEDLKKDTIGFSKILEIIPNKIKLDFDIFSRSSYSSIKHSNEMNPAQINRVKNILKRFNMDIYYTPEKEEPNNRV